MPRPPRLIVRGGIGHAQAPQASQHGPHVVAMMVTNAVATIVTMLAPMINVVPQVLMAHLAQMEHRGDTWEILTVTIGVGLGLSVGLPWTFL